MSNPRAFSGRFKVDAATLARAEAALKGLSSNFEGWMAEELDKLEAARARLHAEGLTAETGKDIYFRVHDLKGLGATYGYPLVTRIAASLCRVLRDEEERLSTPLYLIDAHVDAILAMVRRDIRTDADAGGQALAEELETQVDSLSRAAA